MDDLSRIISTGVGPIIVISACGLLCLAFYNRLAACVTRLRAFHRERIHEQQALDQMLEATEPDALAIVRHRELMGMLEVQTRHVIRRAQWIRLALASFLITILCLSSCALCLGLSVDVPRLIYVAVVLFVVGLLVLNLGVIFALIELRAALDPVNLESRFIRGMASDSVDQAMPL